MATTFTVVLDESTLGTTSPERFMLQIPSGFNADSPEVPLLIAWHGWGSTPNSIFLTTNYAAEADARGWILMCPEYMYDKSFGNPAAQHHVDFSIDWIKIFHAALTGYPGWAGPSGGEDPEGNPQSYSVPPIDTDRIYCVGHSMGGGAAMSYAARHTGLAANRVAAVASLTGTISLSLAYDVASDEGQALFKHEKMFGGDPSEVPFLYQQVSVADIDSSTYKIQTDTTMARNLLGSVPVYMAWSKMDYNTPLVKSNRELEAWFVSNGYPHEGPGEFQPQQLSGDILDQYGGHTWDLVDASTVCDWLGGYRATTPLAASILADRSVQEYDETFPVYWHAMEVAQAESGVFSEISYTSNNPWTSITVGPHTNVSTYSIRAEDQPLSPGAVFRDGVIHEDWVHLEDEHIVRINESEADGLQHKYTII